MCKGIDETWVTVIRSSILLYWRIQLYSFSVVLGEWKTDLTKYGDCFQDDLAHICNVFCAGHWSLCVISQYLSNRVNWITRCARSADVGFSRICRLPPLPPLHKHVCECHLPHCWGEGERLMINAQLGVGKSWLWLQTGHLTSASVSLVSYCLAVQLQKDPRYCLKMLLLSMLL